ncbi:hypothetical protein PsAD2_00869 [Pseudovibrio axinellae]|uniref:DUF3775 domain-containing protein n=1 Tax=Pseudovibrio axinellae TaxID=989403 RepID=A0A166AUL3_9HYPH|nr:DUF3775 domain-containing protein [Pseudovibrio axinellae]KZL21570.1 hypothetical protein PsAD2_00869 [Pseudovibrio axinellae]SER09966.1 Protein of unknown function [Pseudovibrio axinellae]
MAVELALSAETVRMIVQKSRAVSESLPDTYEDGHEGDLSFDSDKLENAHQHDGLAEEEHDDFSAAELKEIIDDLNVDEATELVAITWIGRGDFERADFHVALSEARERATSPVASYLLGLPLLPDYLEAGLEALNL